MRREELMIDDIISIVEKSRINKMSKYVIYDYLNNHIKQALTQPTITNEQVKEDIERVKCLVNLLDEGVQQEMVKDDFNNITQYIAQQDERICGLINEDYELKYTVKTLQSKLDKIEEINKILEKIDEDRIQTFGEGKVIFSGEWKELIEIANNIRNIKSILKEKPND